MNDWFRENIFGREGSTSNGSSLSFHSFKINLLSKKKKKFLKWEEKITIYLTVIQDLKVWTGCKWQGSFRVVSLYVHGISLIRSIRGWDFMNNRKTFNLSRKKLHDALSQLVTQSIVMHSHSDWLIDWLVDWFILGLSPYGPNAPRPYRQAFCAP